MFNLAALTVRSSQQMGLVDASVVGAFCGGYMNGTVSAWHFNRIRAWILYVNTICDF